MSPIHENQFIKLLRTFDVEPSLIKPKIIEVSYAYVFLGEPHLPDLATGNIPADRHFNDTLIYLRDMGKEIKATTPADLSAYFANLSDSAIKKLRDL